MLKNIYNFKQVSEGLYETVKKYKQEIGKPTYPKTKTDWIRETSTKILDLLEKEVNAYNNKYYGKKLGEVDVVSALYTTINLILRALGIKDKKD